MSNDNKTLADVKPGGMVRLADQALSTTELRRNAHMLVLQEMRARFTDAGSPSRTAALDAAIAALSAQPSPGGQGDAPPCWWIDHGTYGQITQRQDEADAAVNAGKRVVSYATQPSPGGLDALDCIGRIEEAIEFRVPHDIYAAVHGELAELKAALAARQPVEFERAIPTRRRESAVELLLSLGFVWNHGRWEDRRQPVTMDDALAAGDGTLHGAVDHWQERALRAEAELAARQPVVQPITVEAVATVRRWSSGERYIDWLTEGGIADLEVGDVLMLSDRAITDEDGSGEVYTAPPAQAVDLAQLRLEVQRLRGRVEPVLGTKPVYVKREEVLALIDGKAAGK